MCLYIKRRFWTKVKNTFGVYDTTKDSLSVYVVRHVDEDNAISSPFHGDYIWEIGKTFAIKKIKHKIYKLCGVEYITFGWFHSVKLFKDANDLKLMLYENSNYHLTKGARLKIYKAEIPASTIFYNGSFDTERGCMPSIASKKLKLIGEVKC